MQKFIVLASLSSLLAIPTRHAQAQENRFTVRGVVRDTAGARIAGALVVVGERQVITNPQGGFQVDSLRPGQYLLLVRATGYLPDRSRIEVGTDRPPSVEIVLVPSAVYLPPVIVAARRTGIYGTVGDTAYRPLAGAKVMVAGANGGETLTDSAGRFGFPGATFGVYVVRVTSPGHVEARLFLELKRGEGKELAIRLVPGKPSASRADAEAIADLGRRLALNDASERLSPADLVRYQSGGLCDVNRITELVGRGSQATVLLVLNGTRVIESFPVRALCSWGANQVELVEFGSSVCRDITRSLADLANRYCTGIPPKSGPRRAVRSMVGGGQPVQRGGGGFVAIWERGYRP
jgi:hypothetical protein